MIYAQTFGGTTRFAGAMVVGVAPAAAATVNVTLAGRLSNATLGSPGHLPLGARFFASFIEHRSAGPSATNPVIVLARDRAGEEIARASSY